MDSVQEAEHSKDLTITSLLVPEAVRRARGSPGVPGSRRCGQPGIRHIRTFMNGHNHKHKLS